MLPKFVFWFASWVMFDAKHSYNTWERHETFDTEDTKNILKIKFTDVFNSIIEMNHEMIERGYVNDARWKGPDQEKLEEAKSISHKKIEEEKPIH